MRNQKVARIKGKHELPVRFMDHRSPKYQGIGTSFGRARHRAEGPMRELTLYDMSSDEFTGIKGAGPTY